MARSTPSKQNVDLKQLTANAVDMVRGLPESLQVAAFNKVFDALLAEADGAEASSHPQRADRLQGGAPPAAPPATKPKRDPTRKMNASGHREPKRLSGLPLRADGTVPSLPDFLKSKNPKTNYEVNAVVLFYLIRVRQFSPVSMDHLYTALRELGRIVPRNFHQHLIDTGRRSHLVNAADLDDLQLTVAGENLVEVELPRK
jgi:hypothetical protein